MLRPFPPLQKIRWKEFPQPAVTSQPALLMRANIPRSDSDLYRLSGQRSPSVPPKFIWLCHKPALSLPHGLNERIYSRLYRKRQRQDDGRVRTGRASFVRRQKRLHRTVRQVDAIQRNENRATLRPSEDRAVGSGMFYRQGSRSDRYPDGTRRSDPLAPPCWRAANTT